MNLIFFFPAAITFFLHPSPPPGENLFRARLSAPFCRQQFAVKGLKNPQHYIHGGRLLPTRG
jgi:hypothetical protein